jgi:ankyrin repeat protein
MLSESFATFFQDRYTPLHHSCLNGHLEVVAMLLSASADIKAEASVSLFSVT